MRDFLFYFVLLLLSCSCQSTLILDSNPPDAEIFISSHGSDRSVSFGKTPIEVSEEDIRNKVGIALGRISLVEVRLEKSGYRTEKVLITGGQWGSLASRMKIKMQTAKKETQQIDVLLQHLMNAQKLTHRKQFARAHDEIDKAIEISPKFGRAHALKGAIFYLQKLYEDSEQWYAKSLDFDPNLTDSIKMLDIIRKKKNRQ